MVGGRAGYEYSTEKGASHHPIKLGYIYRMAQTHPEFNLRLQARVHHVLYIWVQRIGKLKKHNRPNRVNVRIARCLVPDVGDGEDHYIVREATVDKEYLVRLLDGGYQIITDKCKWNGSKWCWGNFYKAIGLL